MVALAMALVPATASAAFFQGFEVDTSGWFPGDGTANREADGYLSPVPYASGISSSEATHHARLRRVTCEVDSTGGGDATACTGAFTRWGGYNSVWMGGYTTQVDVYFDVAYAIANPDPALGNQCLITNPTDTTCKGTRFDFSSAINDASGSFLSDFVFNVGTGPDGPPTCPLGQGFVMTASQNAFRSGGNPYNPAKDPFCINTSGWYTLRHTFKDVGGVLVVDMDLLLGNTIVHSWSIPTTFTIGTTSCLGGTNAGAPCTVNSECPGSICGSVGCNRYGWFANEEIWHLPIDNSQMQGCGINATPTPVATATATPTAAIATATPQQATPSPTIPIPTLTIPIATVTFPLPTVTPTAVPLNHFQCYEVHHPQFSLPGVTLDDQFGPGTVDVGKPKRFCAPADKNDEDPTAPQDPDHLAGYKIRQRTPAFTKLRDQIVVNQFGSLTVDVLKPDLLLVPSAKDLSGPPPPLNPAVVNHFKCHKVRGKFRQSGIKVDDQFINTLTVDLLKPVRLCVRADKNGEGIIDPPDALMCYKVRRPSFAAPPGTVFVNNQFEQSPFDLFRPTEFCVPSQVNPGSQPTSTPTPIQTPSLQCCGPFDQCIDTDGTASAGNGIPGAVEVLIGNPLTPFPAVFNNSGLHMYDNDGNAMWTFGPAGDDLIAEGPTFCPTGIHNGVYDLGLDCPVLDFDGSLFNGQIVDCDLEEGAFCMPPLPVPIEFHDTNLNGAWDDGEDIVLDMNGNGICD